MSSTSRAHGVLRLVLNLMEIIVRADPHIGLTSWYWKLIEHRLFTSFLILTFRSCLNDGTRTCLFRYWENVRYYSYTCKYIRVIFLNWQELNHLLAVLLMLDVGALTPFFGVLNVKNYGILWRVSGAECMLHIFRPGGVSRFPYACRWYLKFITNFSS